MSEQPMNLEQATDSTFAKAFTRFGMPVLLSLVSFFGGLVLLDIRTQVKEQGERSESQGAEIKQVSSDVQLLNAKVDNGLVWRITELERRLNTVEQAQKTP